jgi:hypothetical protein
LAPGRRFGYGDAVSIFTRIFNRLGGYDDLARRYPVTGEPGGSHWDRQCVELGAVRYDWCVAVIVALEGLYVQARPPAQGRQAAMLVPWPEITAAASTRLYWRRATRLTCGEPAVGSITVWQPVWEAAAPLWRAARRAGE